MHKVSEREKAALLSSFVRMATADKLHARNLLASTCCTRNQLSPHPYPPTATLVYLRSSHLLE